MSERRAAAGEQLALVVTELTLAAVTLAALVGFERLFSDDSWRRSVILAAIIAHGVAMALRRLRIPAIVAFALHLAAGAVVATQLLYDHTTRWGLPTRRTLEALEPDLDLATEVFPDAVAPTLAIPGFVAIAVAAIWLLVWLADSLAFRATSTLPALAPAAAIVVFEAALGSTQRRTPLLLLVLAAALVFVVTHRSLLYPTEHRWLGNLTDARSAMARFAAPMALVAGGFAIAALVAVPGADDPIVDLDDSAPGDPARVVISPLVDIRARLVNQENVEVFQVRSAEPAYWRLTALDTFEGEVWSSRADYGDADGSLDLAVESGIQTREVAQHYRIQALAAVWLPAAFQPVAMANLTGADVSWEPESATLIVDRGTSDSDGIEYTVDSSLPEFSADELAALPAGHDPEFDRFTALPDDFSPNAAQLAVDITAGASTPYEQAIALQQYFRSGFTYDLDVAAGHSISRIDDFLAVRRGYCEQFAGTFAAMARSLGLPSRVAVGFTWGDTDPADPTLFRVRGEHAHAWPEVYIESAGWVAFEPTPGRGAPRAGHTQIAPAQDESGPSDDLGSELVPALPQLPDNIAEQLAAQEDAGSGLAPGAGAGAAEPDSSFRVPGWVVVAAVTVAVLAGLAATVPLLRRFLRRRRSHRGTRGDRRRVLDAWTETKASLVPVGLRSDPTETTGEFVARVAPVLGPQPELARLAAAVDQVRYSEADLPDGTAAHAETTHERIASLVRDRTSWWDRYRAEFDLTDWRFERN